MQINYKTGIGFVVKAGEANIALCLPPEKVDGEEIIITASEADEKSLKVNKSQVVFSWPGEYEAKGVSVMVIPVGKEKKSRVVKVIAEDISIVHLDGVAEMLTESEEEKIGNVDILFVSIGKNAALNDKQTKQMIEVIEPRAVVPMNFAAGEEIDFGKLLGFAQIEAKDTWKVKKSDLPADRMNFEVIRPK